MPFTLAHPAAVLPFIKRYKLNATALVAGSMAPDFEYFLRFKPVGLFGHDIWGFLYFNLPLCFLTAYVFHFIVKKPLIACLPDQLAAWFRDFAERPWGLSDFRSVWFFSWSALLGMATHVIWDSFTHQGGRMVEQIPLLSEHIRLGVIAAPGFKILQHGGTLVGLLILMAFCYRRRNLRTKARPVAARIKGLYFGSIVLTGGAACLGMFLGHWPGGDVYSAAGELVITLLNGLVLGTVAASLVIKKSL